MSGFLHVCPYPDCESKFHRPSKLQFHLNKHTAERPFTCDEENCNKSYTNNSHLRRHKLRSHQKGQNKTCKCTVEGCGMEFTNADNMKRHKNTVHRKDYVCAICNEGFNKKHKLRAHMTAHTGETNIKCPLCPSTFKTDAEYKRHKYRHKSYTCSCGEIFHRWTVYTQHRRTKHIQKYICNVCNKEFQNKANRNKHVLVHDEKRTVLQCPIDNCEREYFFEKNLQHHIQVFHMKIKKPPPPSKQKLKKDKKIPDTPKTLLTGRNQRKDAKSIKKSSALKLVGLTVPLEAEKALIEGETIEIEDSDQFFDTSDYSDLEVSVKILPRKDNTSDSDSATQKMVPVK